MMKLVFSAVVVALFGFLSPARSEEDTFDVLLKNYKQFGLPLPPDDAKLVRVDTGWGADEKGTKHTYVLGFLLKSSTREERPKLLVGTLKISALYDEYPLQYNVVEEVPPKADTVDGIVAEWKSTRLDGLNVGLATAIQLKARGWNDLAKVLLDKSLKSYAGHHFSFFYQPPNLPPETALARMAFAHFGEQLSEPHSNWQEIYDRLKAIIAAEPTLNTEHSKGFMERLELSLRPSQAKPGTVEALVDSLITDPEANRRTRRNEKGIRIYDKLEEMGFEAVPTLIAHLDDLRLTPYLKQGFNNFPTYNMNVGALASELLKSISGTDLGKDWLRGQQGWNVEKENAETWWAEAQKHEDDYLARHALPEDLKNTWPNGTVVRLLAKKYPERVLEIYRTILDKRPEMQSYPVADAIADSALPAEKKIEAFVSAGQHKNLEHRRAAFWQLKNLDHQRFVDMLVETLKIIPSTPDGEYWSSREAAFLPLVMQTKDVRAWKAMLETAKQADVGLRMEMITPKSAVPESQRRLLLTFLANFLDDGKVRDVSNHAEKFEGPIAGDGFDRIQIRNQAALNLSWLLKLDMKAKPDWTDEQWATMRAQVKATLVREKIGESFEEQ
jgi:hypothetical protein